jgi:hypothetical protein
MLAPNPLKLLDKSALRKSYLCTSDKREARGRGSTVKTRNGREGGRTAEARDGREKEEGEEEQ